MRPRLRYGPRSPSPPFVFLANCRKRSESAAISHSPKAMEPGGDGGGAPPPDCRRRECGISRRGR